MSTGTNKKISLFAATIIGLNAMIGVGIVVIPSMLSLHVGPAGIFSYALSLLVVITLGIALGRVAQNFPGEGWTYLYPAQWAGHKIGLISGFSYLMGVLVAMGFCIQQTGIWLYQLLPIASPTILGIAIVLILMALVLAGAQASALGQYVIGACVVIPLLSSALVCWANFNPELLHPFMPHGLVSVFAEAPNALFTFLGFECIISLYAVVENPVVNVPKAFIFSILGVGSLYLIFTTGILFSIPSANFSNGLKTTLATVLGNTFPTVQWLSYAVLLGALFGLIGTIHSMLWSASELFTDVLKKVRTSTIKNLFTKNIWTNSLAVVVCTIVMIVNSLLFHAEALIALTNLLIIIPTILGICTLLFIPKEWTWSRNGITIIAICGGLIMIYFAAIEFFHSVHAFLV